MWEYNISLLFPILHLQPFTYTFCPMTLQFLPYGVNYIPTPNAVTSLGENVAKKDLNCPCKVGQLDFLPPP